ncbi:MAG TPA: PepSY-associated TM helix domain-containing protein [Tepidisphaeraceae bacterium]|jgi:uncharacterized iron-regulated membrane protein
MRVVRKIVFWLHLVIGLAVGSVVGLMAGTGVLMAFEHQIVDAVEKGDGAPPTPDAVQLSPEELLASARRIVPDVTPMALTVSADPAAPASVQLGRERFMQLNAYTGERTGAEATKLRGFFHTVLELHRWLTLSGDWRNVGKGITGAAALGFLVLICSGLWLWMPRVWKWSSIRPVLLLNWRAAGKLRDWNWHNALGFWAMIPLLVITMSGLVMSYPWANNLLFRAAGDVPPPPRQERARGQQQQRGATTRPQRAPNYEGLNDLWAAAEEYTPAWTSITLRLGGRRGNDNAEAADTEAAAEGGRAATRGAVTFVVGVGDTRNPQNRTTLTFDRRSGELTRTETFATTSPGRRLRSLVLPLHRGELFGIAGQAVAALASAVTLVLVYTGFALSYRRLVRPVVRRIRGRSTPTHSPAAGAEDDGPLPDGVIATSVAE